MLGDAWARQCGRQQSQALCNVVVRVFWRGLAEAGARRGEWLLLDGLRLGTRIVGSGPLPRAPSSSSSSSPRTPFPHLPPDDDVVLEDVVWMV